MDGLVWVGLMLLSGSWLGRFLVHGGCFNINVVFVFWWFDPARRACIYFQVYHVNQIYHFLVISLGDLVRCYNYNNKRLYIEKWFGTF